MKKNIYYIIFLILIHSHTISQDISKAIYSLLNFHNYEIITPNNLSIQTSRISSNFLYNDNYRKYLHDQKKIGWAGNSLNVASWHSHIGERIKYGLKTKIQSNEYHYQNIYDQKALIIQNHRYYNSVNFQFGVTNDKYFLGGGITYNQSNNTMPLLITEFPTSNTPFNDYFIDFLEPTFGDSLNIEGESHMQNPIIFSTFPIYNQYQMTILFSHLYLRYNIDIDYINSSNIVELTGNRSIEIPAEIKNMFIKTNLSKLSSPIQISLNYFNTDMNLSFNNILPPNYDNQVVQDFDKLGHLNGTHHGGSIEWNYSKNNYQLLLGLGFGNLSGSTELFTPVLGQTILFIPISHGVVGKITGNSTSQQISLNYNKLIKNTEFEILSSYTHGYYDLFIDGDAQLEFGLISVPVLNTLNYHAHFIDLNGNIKKQIGNVAIIFSCTQIIPIVLRTDSSPIKFKFEPSKDSTPSSNEADHETNDINYTEENHLSDYLYNHRGGRNYSISIQYNW